LTLQHLGDAALIGFLPLRAGFQSRQAARIREFDSNSCTAQVLVGTAHHVLGDLQRIEAALRSDSLRPACSSASATYRPAAAMRVR
jgi:hypothetical protein